MRVLSFDPGQASGVALCDESGLFFVITIRAETLVANGFLNALVSMSKPDVILVEGVPTYMSSSVQENLKTTIVSWFRIAGYTVHEIQPGRWKNFVEREKINGSHAIDAASMARWWIENQKDRTNESTNR